MNICPNCLSKIDDNIKYCPKCNCDIIKETLAIKSEWNLDEEDDMIDNILDEWFPTTLSKIALPIIIFTFIITVISTDAINSFFIVCGLFLIAIPIERLSLKQILRPLCKQFLAECGVNPSARDISIKIWKINKYIGEKIEKFYEKKYDALVNGYKITNYKFWKKEDEEKRKFWK